MERLSEEAMEVNDNEVFHKCSYSGYVSIANALLKLQDYEDAEMEENKND